MKRFALLMALTFAAAGTVLAADSGSSVPELQKLDVSAGRWVFHGKSLATPFSKSGTWIWHEDCRWSDNRIFLECTFDNLWSGKAVRSLVVDTWNSTDHSYWHYEFFAAGASGAHPFVSRMTIAGSDWTEYGTATQKGRKLGERILYHFASPARVEVRIEVSPDGSHWVTVDRGTGSRLR